MQYLTNEVIWLIMFGFVRLLCHFDGNRHSSLCNLYFTVIFYLDILNHKYLLAIKYNILH